MSDDHQQIAGRKSFPIEPANVTLAVGCRYTGDSRTAMYDAIGKGDVEAVKQGRRTLLVFASLKKRVASRPPAKIGKGNQQFRELRSLVGTRSRKRKTSRK
jgi:hypothetical protein